MSFLKERPTIAYFLTNFQISLNFSNIIFNKTFLNFQNKKNIFIDINFDQKKLLIKTFIENKFHGKIFFMVNVFWLKKKIKKIEKLFLIFFRYKKFLNKNQSIKISLKMKFKETPFIDTNFYWKKIKKKFKKHFPQPLSPKSFLTGDKFFVIVESSSLSKTVNWRKSITFSLFS